MGPTRTRGGLEYADEVKPSENAAAKPNRNREFWCKGYYVDTVGKNTEKITNYIKNQLKEDHLADQLTMDLNDPFTGK